MREVCYDKVHELEMDVMPISLKKRRLLWCFVGDAWGLAFFRRVAKYGTRAKSSRVSWAFHVLTMWTRCVEDEQVMLRALPAWRWWRGWVRRKRWETSMGAVCALRTVKFSRIMAGARSRLRTRGSMRCVLVWRSRAGRHRNGCDNGTVVNTRKEFVDKG